MNKSKDLIEAMQSKPILKVGGAFDAMSAKLVENAGFDAVWAGSFAISATHALPDASILTMTEFFSPIEKMIFFPVATNLCDNPLFEILASLKEPFFVI